MTSLRELSSYVRAAREDRDLTQEGLAAAIGSPVNRSAVSHLETGRQVPATALRNICEFLGIPRRFWLSLLDDEHLQRVAFEDALGELVGRQVSLRDHDDQTAAVAHRAVRVLFDSGMTKDQLHQSFCAALVNYGIAGPSADFFQQFLRVDAFKSVPNFARAVEAYQALAIRLYSSFRAAYDDLSTTLDLQQALEPLESRDDSLYRLRTDWNVIEEIPEERLPDLGYISAARVKREESERQILADFLNELAAKTETDGKTAVTSYSLKKRRKIDSLLRAFQSTLPHDLLSPLFVPDPDRLRREAAILGPKNASDIKRMGETQSTGLRNLARYLTADFMDVYVATSMRTEADFASVNGFVKTLFRHQEVHPLKLRYFNPTQSWIEDRVAKGLVEALMLKRAEITIYLAQKVDSFGKDSEASVALGQGKPVIVFVPRLKVNEVDIDSELLGLADKSALKKIIETEAIGDDQEVDETTDHQALFAQVLTLRLGRASDEALRETVHASWADFDLYGEDSRIESEDARARYRAWLDAVVKRGEKVNPESDVRADLCRILVATAINAEKRATIFREVHPLALQVILSTGVLNGIIVVRSTNACAAVLGQLVRNELNLELRTDSDNYRLVERATGSTIRVIARHSLIGNAFDAFYRDKRIR